MVKRAAGSTPAILGTKLKQHHFRGDNYLETDLEIGASIGISLSLLSLSSFRMPFRFFAGIPAAFSLLLSWNDRHRAVRWPYRRVQAFSTCGSF